MDATGGDMGKARSDTNNRTIATNKQARRLYAIEVTYEAGLVLQGSEVKSLRAGRVTVGDGYVATSGRELYLVNVHIGEYPHAYKRNHEPRRRRKLLLHRREIDRIHEQIAAKGLTAVPLRFYLKEGRVKVEIGVGRGKKLHDRREDIKRRDAKREMARDRRA